MPIIEDFAPFPNTRILIWQITETIDILLSKIQLDNSSQQILDLKKKEIHKKQFLAIRNILELMSSEKYLVSYSEIGKPYLNSKKNISVTHSGSYAALIVSDKQVGIDLEEFGEKIKKIEKKFLDVELDYPIDLSISNLLVYWNIKESIFKSLENKPMDFRKNIIVLPLEKENNKVKSWYINNNEIYSFCSYYKVSKNYTLAYVIKE
jgi:4'-phosphopantetheinyl transferase EntD